MNKKSLYYYLGVLLLGLAVFSYQMQFMIIHYLGITTYWFFVVSLVTGVILIAISDRKIWLKIVTIILAPILYLILFTVILLTFIGNNTTF